MVHLSTQEVELEATVLVSSYWTGQFESNKEEETKVYLLLFLFQLPDLLLGVDVLLLHLVQLFVLGHHLLLLPADLQQGLNLLTRKASN